VSAGFKVGGILWSERERERGNQREKKREKERERERGYERGGIDRESKEVMLEGQRDGGGGEEPRPKHGH